MSGSNRGKSNGTGMNRRTFLKASVFSTAVIAFNRILKYPKFLFSSSPKSTEGVLTESWIPTSCLNCATRCATRVRVVNGKAVKIDGNPLSQVSEGKICPRGHIGLQVLYDPDRITSPLKRTNPEKGKGIDPGWSPISWSEALEEVSGRLKSLRDKNQPHGLLLLQGLNTISAEDMIHRFAEAYGTPNVVSRDSLEKAAEKSGRWLADGNYENIAYDLGKTNYVLAFGAGIVEYEKPLARNLRMWGKIRRERPNRAKVVVIDPRYSVTAAKADRWIPITPGTDGALAMAIANVIISEKLYDVDFIEKRTTGFEAYRELALSEYSPAKVAAVTGISDQVIQQIAREFAQTRPAIAWVGRGVCGWPNGSYNSYAIFSLNALTGNIDIPGGIIYQEAPGYRGMPPLLVDEIAREGNTKLRLDSEGRKLPVTEASVNKIAEAILNDKPYPAGMAIGLNCNFNMSAPDTERWNKAMKKLPYYIHIAPFISEMAEYADIILPSTTFLEEWAYDHSPPGSGFAEVKIKQPIVNPLPNVNNAIDIIFEIARRLGGTVADSFAGMGNDAQGFVRYRTQPIVPWDEFLDNGVWVGPAYQYRKYDRIFKTPSGKFEFRSGNLESTIGRVNGTLSYLPHYEESKFIGDKNNYPLMLSTYQPLLDVENGGQNYPWAQEIFFVMHGVGWRNFVEINSQTARALGIRDGDLVWVESPVKRIKAKARVMDWIHPQVVSIASGQGHYAGGKWQNGIGVNPNEIIGADYDQLSGQSSLFNTRVKVYRV